jgi:hypothetical protein
MAQNKVFNNQPALVSTASNVGQPNLFNCAVTTLAAQGIGFVASQPYGIIKKIHAVNTLTTTAVFLSLFKGATLTSFSTQAFVWSSVSIPASQYLDDFGQHRFDSTDYMIGYCNLQNAVVINMNGEIGLA